MSWNLATALGKHCEADPRERRTRFFDILDSIFFMGAAVACLQETGLAVDSVTAENWLAQWSRINKCPARIWLARGARQRSAGSGGSASGIAIVAFGSWAARGQSSRAWANGRGLFVEFALMGASATVRRGRASTVVGCLYGPSGTNGASSLHERFRSMVSEEWHDCRKRGLAPIFVGDMNFAPSLQDRQEGSTTLPVAEAAAWLREGPWTDVWRLLHPDSHGFTREEGSSKARLDMALLPVSADNERCAASGIWIGPCGEESVCRSDHRPLIVDLHMPQWVGTVSAGTHIQRPTAPAPTAWPAASLFTSDPEELAAVAAEAEETKRLPVKLSWAALAEIQDGDRLAPLLQRLTKTCDKISLASSQAEIDVSWSRVNEVGQELRDELLSLVHRPALADLSTNGKKNGPLDQKGGEPRWGAAFADLRLLRLWAARVRRHGCGTLLPSAPRWLRPPGASSAEAPEFVVSLWQDALFRSQGDSVDMVRSVHSTARVIPWAPGFSPPTRMTSYDWFHLLACQEIRRRQRSLRIEETSRKRAAWKRREARLAAEVRAGRTGAIFERVLGPKRVSIPANSIWVPVEEDEMGRPLLELQTDRHGVLRGARETGYTTTSASGEHQASSRADGLTAAELDEGALPERFHSLDMAALRQILSPAGFKAPISNEQLLAEWSGPRLREALKFAKLNTAAGPSGCSYRLLFHSSDSFLRAIAAFMRACVRCKRIPTAARHSYVRLVPKSGAGGATLEGARQICLIEVLVKLISADIGRAAMDHWEKFGYLDPAQTGFRRFRNAADVTAAVNAVLASHRRAGTPLYVISGDIEKAFQRVPHWALERALRRLGFSTEAAKFWMETDRSRDGPVATCQFWTDHGLTDSFEVEAGARMGEAGSAIKFLVWMDALLVWLRSRHDRGLQFSVQADGGEVVVDLGVIAYADDLLIIARSLQEAQAILTAIDTFLSAFGVNLQPSKSVALKVGGAWLPGERLTLIRDGTALPLKLAAPHEGVRYLGVWLQADGGWSSMEAQIRNKVCKWMSALRQAGRSISAEHADLFVRSKVGGLMRFAFAAAPLSHQLAVWMDDKIGRAVVGRTGGAVGENKFICVKDAFLTRPEGGLGLESMVDLRRSVILGRTLLRLSRAAVQSGPGADQVAELVVERAWLYALDSRSRLGGNEGAGLWQPSAPSANSKIFDHIDAARAILAELQLRVRDDRARPRPRRRRLWDIPTESVFLAMFAASPGSSLALKQHRSHLSAFNKHEQRLPTTSSKRYLSSMLNYSGKRLQSAAAIFNSAPPMWFRAMEAFLLDPLQSGRTVKEEWQTASREDVAPPPGGQATQWVVQPRAARGSAIWVKSEEGAFPSPTVSGRYKVAPEHVEADGRCITVTYESVTDGTGSGHGGFAFKVTLDEQGAPDAGSASELSARLEEVGWTAAPPRSDRAELAGLVHQLRRAPDRSGVRLLSDCLSMLLLAQWSGTAPLDKIFGHEHRGLLLEWRRLLSTREHAPLLGWLRGHTERCEWPYPAQIACDSAAAWTSSHAPEDEAWSRSVPSEEATFVLWDDLTDRPVLGGWASAIQARCQALRLRTISTRYGAGSGARQWHRVREGFVHGGEWDRRRLRARACPAGRARTAAQADTLWGPGKRSRWDDEQPYRRRHTLLALERSCTLCAERFLGSWERHITTGCKGTAPVWERAEAVIGREWAALCAWDFAEADQLLERYRPLWTRWCAGEEIAGFSLQSWAPPGAVVTNKLCALDGEPTVIPVEQVQRRTKEFKAAARLAADSDGRLLPEGTARPAPQSSLVLRHRSGLSVLPIKFLELWHGFAGHGGQEPSQGFSDHIVSLLVQESTRAQEVAHSRSRAAKHDFWCLWGGFMAWLRRQCSGELTELFTGMLNRTGPWTHLFTAEAGDRVWGAQTNAWEHEDGRPRTWGLDSPADAWLSGNPPYSRAEVLDFCSFAARAARPLVGIIPRSSDGLDNIPDVLRSGGQVAAHFQAGTLAFTPFGHWFGHETRGDHKARRADLEILFVTWRSEEHTSRERVY